VKLIISISVSFITNKLH